MAMPTTDELLDDFKNMTVLELNDFLKTFEEEFDVTAAAPVAVAAAAPAAGGGEAAAAEEKDEFDVVLVAGRRQEDPGHQGGPVAHEPRAQGGQGPRRLRPEARPREGREGRGREGQGPARGGRRHRRAQVALRGRDSLVAGPPRAARSTAVGWLAIGDLLDGCLTPAGGRRILPTVPAAPLGAGPLRLHCVAAARAVYDQTSRVDSARPALEVPGLGSRAPAHHHELLRSDVGSSRVP